jgi:hypothetical protein
VTTAALRWLARAHGILAWAAAAALVGAFAAALVGRGLGRRAPSGDPEPHRSNWARRARVAAAGVAATLLSGAFAAGLALDLPYRGRLRQRVFLDAPALGWLFERKLHFAFGAAALAWCALGLLTAAVLRHGDGTAAPPWARDLERAGRAALAGSAALATIAAILSAMVARRHSF